MSDKLSIQNGKAILTTEEGQRIERKEEELVKMMRQEILPPFKGEAMPDGLKFFEWRPPYLLIVHQLPAHVRQLRWIDNKSPEQYGPGTTYRTVRISLPYAITFATYYQHGGKLALTAHNELYFRNEPLQNKSDRLGFPAVLNISAIKTKTRVRAWICTQYLRNRPTMDWTAQLAGLLDHTWNGGFNFSSEHNEGASWFGESKGIHKNLHPIEKWEKASKADEAFALSVPWRKVPMNVGQLMHAILNECQQSSTGFRRHIKAEQKPQSLVQRFINFAQKSRKKSA